MGKPRETPPPEAVTLLLDECLATGKESEVYRLLFTLSNVTVKILSEEYGREVKDVVWLPQVAARGWVILTRDKQIRRRTLEVEAWKRSKATVCVLTSGQIDGEQAAKAFHKAMEKIRHWLTKYDRPLIITVSHLGNPEIKTGNKRGGAKRDALTYVPKDRGGDPDEAMKDALEDGRRALEGRPADEE